MTLSERGVLRGSFDRQTAHSNARGKRAKGQKLHRTNSRPARLDIAPVGGIDLVHFGKVIHVGEEDVDLDDLFNARASGFEDGREVLDALVLVDSLASYSSIV